MEWIAYYVSWIMFWWSMLPRNEKYRIMGAAILIALLVMGSPILLIVLLALILWQVTRKQEAS